MARIETYDNDTSISANDRVIGSDADNGDLTQNYTMGDILSYVQNNITVQSEFSDTPASPTVGVATGGGTAYFSSTMPANSMGAGDVLKFRLVATTQVGFQATNLNLNLGILVNPTFANVITDSTTAALTIIVDGYTMVKALNDVEVSITITRSGVSYNYSAAGRLQSSFSQNLTVERTLTCGFSVNAGETFDLTVQAFNVRKL